MKSTKIIFLTLFQTELGQPMIQVSHIPIDYYTYPADDFNMQWENYSVSGRLIFWSVILYVYDSYNMT